MDRNLQKEFLELFPTDSKSNQNITPSQSLPPTIQYPKTSVQSLLNTPMLPNTSANTINNWDTGRQSPYEYYSNNNNNNNNKTKPWLRKLLIAFLIGVLGAVIYSTLAYTFCDNLFDNCSISLFADDGQPKLSVITLHTIVFVLAIYLILSAFKVQ